MFNGTLKALFIFGMVYLIQINERLTTVKAMKAAKLVTSATVAKLLRKTNIAEKNMTNKTANHGVLVLS